MTFDTIIRSESADLAVADGVIAARRGAGRARRRRARGHRRARSRHPAGPDRRARALQRPRARRLGGLGQRHARARGRRLHVRRRHAAELRPADDRRTRRSRPSWLPRGARRTSTSRSGAASCPGASSSMDELAACGVVGFKAFMADSGIDDFPACDDLTLYEGMCRAASLGLPVAVHAENAVIVRELGLRALAAGRTGDGRLRRLAARRRRGRRHRERARDRRRGRLRPAHRPRLERAGRGARGRGPRGRGRRDLRDLPALPRPHGRGRRAHRRPGQVRPAAAQRAGAARAAASRARRHDRLHRLGPLALAAAHEGRPRLQRLGRHLGLPDDSPRAAGGGPHEQGSGVPLLGRPGPAPRACRAAASSRARAPTCCCSTRRRRPC